MLFQDYSLVFGLLIVLFVYYFVNSDLLQLSLKEGRANDKSFLNIFRLLAREKAAIFLIIGNKLLEVGFDLEEYHFLEKQGLFLMVGNHEGLWEERVDATGGVVLNVDITLARVFLSEPRRPVSLAIRQSLDKLCLAGHRPLEPAMVDDGPRVHLMKLDVSVREGELQVNRIISFIKRLHPTPLEKGLFEVRVAHVHEKPFLIILFFQSLFFDFLLDELVMRYPSLDLLAEG